MKKLLAILLCMVMVFSFVACNSKDNVAFTETESQTTVANKDYVAFTQTESKTVVANNGTEYVFVGFEGAVACFGDCEFIGHVEGEKKSFRHLMGEIKTGMYSVNGKQDVLVRYYPDNEFSAIYVKSDLLKKEITLDNCIRFGFVKGILFDRGEAKLSKTGITECQQFLNEIKNGQTVQEAGLYDLVRQPNGMLKNCYVYGYACGVIQEDLNIVIPLEIMSFDDQAYSITIDDIGYVLPKELLDKLNA